MEDNKAKQWEIEAYQNRMRAIVILNKIHESRKGKKYKLFRKDNHTWVEKEIK